MVSIASSLYDETPFSLHSFYTMQGLSLAACCIVTFAISGMMEHKGRFDMVSTASSFYDETPFSLHSFYTMQGLFHYGKYSQFIL